MVYVGSTYDEPLPAAFLDDVTATTKPVVWIYDNIWQLTARDPDFAAKRGFTWKQLRLRPRCRQVNYKGTTLTRDPQQRRRHHGLRRSATRPRRRTLAHRGPRRRHHLPVGACGPGNFTYVGEIPFAYMTHDDRYLAFADLLFDVLAPATAGAAPGAGAHRGRRPGRRPGRAARGRRLPVQPGASRSRSPSTRATATRTACTTPAARRGLHARATGRWWSAR